MKRCLYTALLLILGSVLGCGCASNMLYYPTAGTYGHPSQLGYRCEDVTFSSRDGTILSGWFVPAVGESKGTVVHFHGNR